MQKKKSIYYWFESWSESSSSTTAGLQHVFKCKQNLFQRCFFFPKWEVSDSIHVFICEAGVKRMLLKIKLRWCAAQTCAEVYYEACWGALNEAWVSLPRSARPVLTPNERLCISPLQCLTVITRSHRVGIIIFNTLLITRPKHLVENQDVVITLP